MMRTAETMTDLLRQIQRRLARLEHRPSAPRATWGRVVVNGTQPVTVTYPTDLFDDTPCLLVLVEGSFSSRQVTNHTKAGFTLTLSGTPAAHTVNWHALSSAS